MWIYPAKICTYQHIYIHCCFVVFCWHTKSIYDPYDELQRKSTNCISQHIYIHCYFLSYECFFFFWETHKLLNPSSTQSHVLVNNSNNNLSVHAKGQIDVPENSCHQMSCKESSNQSMNCICQPKDLLPKCQFQKLVLPCIQRSLLCGNICK